MASEPITDEALDAAHEAYLASEAIFSRGRIRDALRAALAVMEREKASRKQCSCPDATYQAVLLGGTCDQGGCPHGGDF